MARRVCSEERVWIEVLSSEGLSDAEIAARLGRDRATVWREKKRCAPGGRRPAPIRGREGFGCGGWPLTRSCA